MKLQEAFDEAMSSLNAGGVPVVLARLSGGLKDAVHVYEVRIRWTGCKDPWKSSDRGLLIVGARRRTAVGWLEWRSIASPFSVDDMTWSFWAVRYPDHPGRAGYPCPACAQEELRTDPEMVKLYGSVTSKHRCGTQAFNSVETNR